MPRFLSSWFRLLRVPNLFSAPGDALAGLFLASLLTSAPNPPAPSTALWLSAASFLAYAFGILTNDLFDLKEDRSIRPERPLPSGAVAIPAVVVAALATAAGSLLAAWRTAPEMPRILWADGLLLAVILLYDGGAKRRRVFGSAVMGLCRGCNVLLGVAACGPFPFHVQTPSAWRVMLAALAPAVAVTLVIAVVTWIADGENRVQRLGAVVFIPSATTLASWLGVLFVVPWGRMFPTGAFCLSFLFIGYAAGSHFLTGLSLFRNDAPPSLTRPAIGAFIRTLLPWQIAWILLHGTLTSYAAAAALLLAWYLAQKLARLFPQT